MDKSAQEIVDVVEQWGIQKEAMFNKPGGEYHDGANRDSYMRFIELHNTASRRLIRLLERETPEFWESCVELAQQAATITGRGKTFVDGQDRSQVGM